MRSCFKRNLPVVRARSAVKYLIALSIWLQATIAGAETTPETVERPHSGSRTRPVGTSIPETAWWPVWRHDGHRSCRTPLKGDITKPVVRWGYYLGCPGSYPGGYQGG